jgi:hypothetical protein
MTTPSTPPDRSALNQKLVHELVAMRDALVTLSLCLKDWQFELDQPGRQAAQHHLDTVLGPMRLGSQVQDNNDAHQKPL